jgi:bacterioferritin-associated ferredoxin
MYVCLRNGYTDCQIRSCAAVCATVSGVYRTLGSPPRCGKGVPMVADMCREAAAEMSCAWQDLDKLLIGEDVREILDCDLRRAAMPALREGVAHCEAVRDYIARELLEDIFESEEEHVDFIETQLEVIDQMGIQNYIQRSAEPAKS